MVDDRVQAFTIIPVLCPFFNSMVVPSPTSRLARLAILFFALTLLRTSAQQPGNDAIERGRNAFGANCGFCHGAQANGTEQAPSLTRSRLVRQDQNGEVLGPMIKAGRPTLGMPAFASLPPQQITDIVAFLHARAKESRGVVIPETAMIVGNAESGKAFFNGQGRCSTCHSVTGDLGGIGSKLTPMVLTTSFLTPPPQPLQVKVSLPSGETVSGKLDYLDEFTVSLIEPSKAYRSWSRRNCKSVEIIDPLDGHKKLLPQYTDDQIHNLVAYLVTLK